MTDGVKKLDLTAAEKNAVTALKDSAVWKDMEKAKGLLKQAKKLLKAAAKCNKPFNPLSDDGKNKIVCVKTMMNQGKLSVEFLEELVKQHALLIANNF